MKPFEGEIVPGFESVRGLNMIDASQLHHVKSKLGIEAEAVPASGD